MTPDRVHSAADLATWDFPGVALAVLGHPVVHSLSPAMHNAALADLAARDPAFRTWRYFKFDIPAEELAAALPRFHRHGFRGLNLTLPHKTVAVPLVCALDEAAAAAGSVNTLEHRENGYAGFTTDGDGLSRALAADLDVSLPGAAVILLGAGGAARAAAARCVQERCAQLWIGNRSPARLQELLRAVAPLARRSGVVVHGFDLARPPASLPPDAVVVNATSAGLKADDPPPIDLARLAGEPRVYDMIYNPPVTPLLQAARARGLRAANGLSMLVHQGVRSLEIWSGRPVSAAVMRAACAAALPVRP